MHARIALVCLIIFLALAAGSAVASWVPAAVPAVVPAEQETSGEASEFSPSLDDLALAIEAAVLAPEPLMESGPMADDSLAGTATILVIAGMTPASVEEEPSAWMPGADVPEPVTPRTTRDTSGGLHLIVLAPVVLIALAILLGRQRSALAG
jgi:hypothetical protein